MVQQTKRRAYGSLAKELAVKDFATKEPRARSTPPRLPAAPGTPPRARRDPPQAQPRSVISPLTSRAGATSKPWFATGEPAGTRRTVSMRWWRK
jgi:hypothetical protein